MVDVTTRNAMRAMSISLDPQHFAAAKDQLTWTVSFTVTPAGAGNFFFFLQNTSAIRDLFISRIQAGAALAEQIIVQAVSGTPVGGTAVTPLNRSVGSTRTYAGTTQQGTNITGLTTIAGLERLRIAAGAQDSLELTARPIYLPRNTTSAAIGFSAVTGAVALNVLVDVAVQSWDNEDII